MRSAFLLLGSLVLSIADLGLALYAQPGAADPTWSTDGWAWDGANTGVILNLLVQPDGSVLVAGRFDRFGATARDRIVRLYPDGAVDLSFVSDHRLTPGLLLTAMARQIDGSLVLGGGRASGNGLTNWLDRVDVAGVRDPGFPAVSDWPGRIEHILLTPLQEIVVVGSFDTIQGQSRAAIARLLPSGLLDPTFAPPPMPDATAVSAATLLPDGKLLVAYVVPELIGGRLWSKTRLRQLDRHGNLDPAFIPSEFAQTYLGALLNDGTGWWLGVSENDQAGLIRLNADGTRDQAFRSELPSAVGSVHALLRQGDGKVIVALDAEAGLIRLRRDGRRDDAFVAPNLFRHPVNCLALSPDGNAVYVGDSSGYVARLRLSEQPEPTWVPAITALQLNGGGGVGIQFIGSAGATVTVEASRNLMEWLTVDQQTATGTEQSAVIPSPPGTQEFYRISARW